MNMYVGNLSYNVKESDLRQVMEEYGVVDCLLYTSCSPTGIVIGPPVGNTFIPRCKPSVLSMTTVRTVFSPMCCWTSTISFLPSCLFISNASWILGYIKSDSVPSKYTSTTGPITWEICPIICDISNLFIYPSAGHLLHIDGADNRQKYLLLQRIFLKRIQQRRKIPFSRIGQ